MRIGIASGLVVLFCALPGCATKRVLAEQGTLAVLWYRHAAECRALYYQACNVARRVADERLAKGTGTRKPAIILDIDETVLDNSPYQAELIRNGDVYSEASWSNWVAMARAEALPGVVDFLKYLDSRQVEIFYISSRKAAQQAATEKNLRELGFPQTDPKHVLLRTDPKTSSKDDRRMPLLTNGVHEVILLLGDNLSDFDSGFEVLNEATRRTRADAARARFGAEFIVLPNPMYGDWENALYVTPKLPVQQKVWVRTSKIQNPNTK